eukprot:GFYU01007687.1.p1 GENE.GFYU01007687.1~~GFYU01007687.1.p1  ORF type:complete len:518 (-),score=170.19 GFYU01007687.1:304-1857(-)
MDNVIAQLQQEEWPTLLEHIICALAVIRFTKYMLTEFKLSTLLKVVPGAAALVDKEIEKEVDNAVKMMFKEDGNVKIRNEIPSSGVKRGDLIKELQHLKTKDADASEGKTFAYVYDVNMDGHEETVMEANTMFLNENALNPTVFPSLKKFEAEVVSMSASMLGGGRNVVGSMTSGGTESILLAVKTYRDFWRSKGIVDPELVIPTTGHPAFDKAGHYFGVKVVRTPVDGNMAADVDAMRRAITSNTILLVGSAPQYPHGVVDPITQIAKMAKSKGLSCHVDACIGGFMLPWVKKLGYPVPDFDFTVDGVTSISADLHKYGYSSKGASVILYHDASLRKHQFFVTTEWPGGLFISPTVAGTRGGGSIAAAWASLVHLGQEGFMKVQRGVMETAKFFQTEIAAIDGLAIVGTPHMSLVSFESTDSAIDVLVLADLMEKHGWHIERQQKPPCIHMTVMPPHAKIKEAFVKDLKAAVVTARKDPSLKSQGSAAMYGMVAKIPDNSIVENFLTTFLDKVYRT